MDAAVTRLGSRNIMELLEGKQEMRQVFKVQPGRKTSGPHVDDTGFACESGKGDLSFIVCLKAVPGKTLADNKKFDDILSKLQRHRDRGLRDYSRNDH